VNTAFATTIKTLVIEEKKGTLAWGKHRETAVLHPTKIESLSKMHISANGSGNCINATKESNGPSWRMIVHLTDEVEAYGVYPGGQSGNPGSKYYDNFINTWVAGKYNTLLFIAKENIKDNKNIKWHLSFEKT
jgi:penicillin amidase